MSEATGLAFWRCFLRQACGPRRTEVGSAGSASDSPFQRWAFKLLSIWSASRTARRASSPLTLGREIPRAALTKSVSSSAQGLEWIRLDLVHSEDFAEEMLAHSGWLAQVDAFQIQLAALELFGWPHQRRFLGGEVERRVPLRAQMRILRVGV